MMCPLPILLRTSHSALTSSNEPPPTPHRTANTTTQLNRRPIQQQYRQPVLLHPTSYHPSKGTWPKERTSPVLLKQQPTPLTAWTTSCGNISLHSCATDTLLPATKTVTKLVNLSYFPSHTTKKEWEYKPIIKYSWTQTRPTKKQLTPLEIKDYHLIPSMPLAPLKGLLSYQPPNLTPNHTVDPCGATQCLLCQTYNIFTTCHLSVPTIPCLSGLASLTHPSV